MNNWTTNQHHIYALHVKLQQVDLMGITIKSLAEIEKEVSISGDVLFITRGAAVAQEVDISHPLIRRLVVQHV